MSDRLMNLHVVVIQILILAINYNIFITSDGEAIFLTILITIISFVIQYISDIRIILIKYMNDKKKRFIHPNQKNKRRPGGLKPNWLLIGIITTFSQEVLHLQEVLRGTSFLTKLVASIVILLFLSLKYTLITGIWPHI